MRRSADPCDGIVDDPQRRDDIDHFGRRQQTAEAEDAVGHPGVVERIGEQLHVTLRAEQDRSGMGATLGRESGAGALVGDAVLLGVVLGADRREPLGHFAAPRRRRWRRTDGRPARRARPGRGASGSTATDDAALASRMALAAVSTPRSLRQLIIRLCCRAVVVRANARGKAARLSADAPRQP